MWTPKQKNQAEQRQRKRSPQWPPKSDDFDDNKGYQGFWNKRLSDEEQQSNKDELLRREDYLVFMSELVSGYALKK